MTQTDDPNPPAAAPGARKTIPITIVTGFLGAGKTTLILNLVPQLRAKNPSYKMALLKNEFGDVAVDSQLASSSAIAGVSELLSGCICCNLVGQLGPALAELRGRADPDRVVIETSGSAFPATLALEVNRLARESRGEYVLDGVVSVIDVENWQGYEDTSYTARLQARYTDLVVFNKWEGCSERRFDEVLDRLGDLEVDVAWVKSDRGWVDAAVVFGIDGALARGLADGADLAAAEEKKCAQHGDACAGHGDHDHHDDDDDNDDDNNNNKNNKQEHHQSEVEVLSVELKGGDQGAAAVDVDKLLGLLKSAPKDEVYRIKGLLTASSPSAVKNSDEDLPVATPPNPSSNNSNQNRYILNWAFGRWMFTPMAEGVKEDASSGGAVLKLTFILARYESAKWKKKLEAGGLVELHGAEKGELTVTRVK